MHDQIVRLPGSLVTVDEGLEREFEARLAESSTLAFRVAYSVLRRRRDGSPRRPGRHEVRILPGRSQCRRAWPPNRKS